jgi:hypothetical protein
MKRKLSPSSKYNRIKANRSIVFESCKCPSAQNPLVWVVKLSQKTHLTVGLAQLTWRPPNKVNSRVVSPSPNGSTDRRPIREWRRPT